MNPNLADVSGEVERLLSSIDAELLKNPSNESEENSDDEAPGDDLDTTIDPALLKELQDLAVEKEETSLQVLEPTLKTIDSYGEEDPEILRELALLSGIAPSEPSIKSNITLTQVQQRQYELKSCAVTFKKNRDITMAKQLMFEAKKLDSALELLSNGFPLESNFVLPPVPAVSIQPTTPPKVSSLSDGPAQKNVDSKDSTSRMKTPDIINKVESEPKLTLADQFDQIIGKLEDQAEEAGNLARQFYRLGDRSNALRFQRYRKGFVEQSKNVQNSRQLPFQSLPSTRLEEVTYSLPQEELDIGPNSLELWIGRAWDLSHPQLGVQLPDSYIQYNLGFAPPGAPGGNTGYSPVSYRSADPNYNFTTLLGVDNTRTWQRHAERKSLAIEVFHYRGMLFRSWSIGKVAVPLAPLLSTPILTKTIELVNPSTRRPTGGRLELRLRLRRSILPQPAKKIKLQWQVVVETMNNAPIEVISDTQKPGELSKKTEDITPLPEGNSSNSTLLAKSADKTKDQVALDEPVSESRSSPGTPEMLIDSKPDSLITPDKKVSAEQGASSNISDSKQQDKATLPDEEYNDRILNEFYDLNRIISKPVLEIELEKLTSQSSPPGPLPSDLGEWDPVTRHSDLSLRLQMIEIKAEMGQLDPSEYLASLHKAIVSHKKLAVKLKQLNFLSLARIVLTHIRTMQGEVDELVSMGIS